ncbi:MAG: hypothetical protein H6710_06455 [Myxococcales bacterium]|nr:hypothetical protein [Myxococcales bacterium]MCB9704579.1 hypothetical protein [Myxococcales bacterium]
MSAPNREPAAPRPPLPAKIAALLVSGSVASLALLQGFGAGCEAVEGSARQAPAEPAAAAPAEPPGAQGPPADAPEAAGTTGGDDGAPALITSPGETEAPATARYIGGSKSDVDIWGFGPDESPKTLEPGAAPEVKRKPSRLPRPKAGPEEGAR